MGEKYRKMMLDEATKITLVQNRLADLPDELQTALEDLVFASPPQKYREFHKKMKALILETSIDRLLFHNVIQNLQEMTSRNQRLHAQSTTRKKIL